MTTKHQLLLSALFLLVCAVGFNSCTSDQLPVGDLIELPADGPVLVVGNPDRTVLDQLKSALSKKSLTAPYRNLDEDSLFNYRNLVLLRVDADSLTAHRRRAVERFVLAGGQLLIIDDRPEVPYAWSWYEGLRKVTDQVSIHGTG